MGLIIHVDLVTDAPCHSRPHCSQICLRKGGVFATPPAECGETLANTWSVMPSLIIAYLVFNCEAGKQKLAERKGSEK